MSTWLTADQARQYGHLTKALQALSLDDIAIPDAAPLPRSGQIFAAGRLLPVCQEPYPGKIESQVSSPARNPFQLLIIELKCIPRLMPEPIRLADIKSSFLRHRSITVSSNYPLPLIVTSIKSPITGR